MRFSPISEPQRNATVLVDIDLAQENELPARPRDLRRQREGSHAAAASNT